MRLSESAVSRSLVSVWLPDCLSRRRVTLGRHIYYIYFAAHGTLMEVGTVLHRGASEGALPPEVFVRVRAQPKRPKQEYRVHIREPNDVEIARRRGLPMFLLTGEVPTRFHYPMRFPPVLVMGDRLKGVVDTNLRRIFFRDASALRAPKFEALVTMMLPVDPLAARAMLVRNPGFDPTALMRFVVGERLERPATAARFQEFAPNIPVIGDMLRKGDLHRQDRNNPG